MGVGVCGAGGGGEGRKVKGSRVSFPPKVRKKSSVV